MGTENLLTKIKFVYIIHKSKLDNLKESRSKADEENWTDTEIKSVDDQITILASILSDIHRNILCCHD